jgi:hypothetical protein
MTQLEIAQLFLQAPGEGEPLVGSHNFQDDSFDLCQFQKWGWTERDEINKRNSNLLVDFHPQQTL